MSATLMPTGKQYFANSFGAPLSGGKVYTYDTGTNTPRPTYQDAAATVPNTNPVVLDARGEALIFWSGTYKIVLKDASDNTIWTVDGVADPSLLPTSLDTALRADLANTTLSTKGAGMIGFNASLGGTYGTGSVGARVNKAGHPTQTNVIIGFGALSDFGLLGTVGYRNVAIGVNTLAGVAGAVAAGGSNVAVGFGAGQANVEGSGNVYLGALVATSNISGDHNNIVGYRALDKHTSSLQNNVFGFNGAFSLTAGTNNSLFGESVMYTATNVTGACLFGAFAGYSRQTGDYPVAFGYQAGFGETTAVGNTLIGKRAGFPFSTQGGNTLIGFEVGDGVAGGTNNTMVGYQAGKGINGATGSVFIGYWAGLRVSTGSNNVLIGQQSGQFITTGADNVLIGQNAGSAVAGATQTNTMIGSVTGQNVNGNANTFLGYNAGSTAAAQTYTNVTCLGANTVPTGSNQITMGDTSITLLRCNVTVITALSDERDKKDIGVLDLPDEFLDEVLTPAVYRWAMRDGTDRGTDLQVGVIAQHLKAAQDKFGLQWLALVDESNPDRLEATPGKLLPMVCLRTQRQQQALMSLASRVAKLEGAENV